jgi:hypothetical protein
MGDVSSGMASTIIQIFLKVSRDTVGEFWYGTVSAGMASTIIQTRYSAR